MEKIKINLAVLLPEIPDERDACVQRLISMAKRQRGIEKVHLVPKDGDNDAQFCFHYNPDIISMDQIQHLAQEAGASITHKYHHLLIDIGGIRDMMQASFIEKEIRAIKGVEEVSVSAAGPASLEYDQSETNEQKILDAISRFKLTIKTVVAPKIDKYPETNGLDEQPEAAEAHQHVQEVETIVQNKWTPYRPVLISFTMMVVGILADYYFKPAFFTGWLRFVWYALAYLPVGWPVAAKGFRLLVRGDVFTEFALMSIASIGAFCIKEYPEGVAVMVFYTVGELFQDAAVGRAKRSIKALLDIRPDKAFVRRDGTLQEVKPQDVKIGEIILIKAGEKVPLDGEMFSDGSSFNTAALTGESKPTGISKGGIVMAGMVNQQNAVELRVTKLYNDSSLARILSLVQEATTRKAKTEQFIRKFSRIYTPTVVFLAIGIATIPYFFVSDYVFSQWLYRSLIFLVISCPCALVISIPLGYFGGIGAASRNGILFKGSNFLDLITKVKIVVMDKTGTLTKGVFKVQQIKSLGMPENEWLPMAAALEANSTHPIAKAVVEYAGDRGKDIKVDQLEEVSGQGIKGIFQGREVLAGNLTLIESRKISVTPELRDIVDSIVIVAINGQLAGYITIADEIKEDSKEAIGHFQDRKIETIMLSGDKQAVVDKVAKELGIDKAYGGLLPEHKVQRLEEIKGNSSKVVAFVGDGINDAPVLALSDVGIAMGGLGSDAAIETADVIVQTDQPSKIVKAIDIGRATSSVVWQNIIFAFIVKGIVMVLGAGGIATMWEAVFADVGVALLAILNAMRIQKKNF
jgi:Cd2+/Zn2+-exporting ATPase